MAYTFLQGVNNLLREAQIIQTDLSNFTDSARQDFIDGAITAWNDAIDNLRQIGIIKGETDSKTFTLVTSTREYTLDTDFEIMVGNPVDSTNVHILTEYPGGFLQMRVDQPDPSQFTGRPNRWTINPTTGDLRLDTDPTSGENGDIYTYIFEKRINLSVVGDSFPVSDQTIDALLDAAVQIFNRRKKRQFDAAAYQVSMSKAAQFASQSKLSSSWGVRRASAR